MSEGAPFQDVIRCEYARRKQRNAAYSLRAFARDLEMTYSRLNEVINEKRGLSPSAALHLGKKLELSHAQLDLFVTQVEAKHARNKIDRANAHAKLEKIAGARESAVIQADVFEMIAHWCHYAILELPAVKGFRSDIDWIARKLGLSAIETKAAVERLLRIGLLKKEKRNLVPESAVSLSASEIPSRGLKLHHEQILQKASAAIYDQSLEERDLSAITIAVSTKNLPRAKERLREFRRAFAKEFSEDSAEKDAVYNLAIQFFRLDKNLKEK